MMITMGKFTGHVPPGGVTRSGDGRTTYRVQLDRGEGEPFLQLFLADRLKDHSSLGGRIQADSSSVTSGLFDEVTLVFQQPKLEGNAGDDEADLVKTTYDIDSAMYEKALPEHINYCKIWDHSLWEFVPTGEAAGDTWPEWTYSSVTGEEADGETYLYSKDMPTAKQDKGSWLLLVPASKPGVTTYLCPGVIVNKREYFRSESSMEAAFRKRGFIEAPGKFAHLAGSWLVTDCSPDTEDDYFVCVTQYTGADSWDEEIYRKSEEE